ncbi:MAG: hypothetical protein KatS3mg105_0936 [Gemmatales bacterium]|nr:MAG: hypothetical protein KatS3mg105_0936 [Gemmatales bacterium]
MPVLAIRRPISKLITPLNSWPPFCRVKSKTATSATSWFNTSTTLAGLVSRSKPPNVNAGEADFTVADGAILFGLRAIKGLGRSAAEEIVRARNEKGPFRDFYDFCERVDVKMVTSAAIEKLIKAGAFDELHSNRAALMHVLPKALQAAAELQEDRLHGQRNFFDMFDDDAASPTNDQMMPDIPDWPNNVKLKYEKEALDFYFSSHPLAQYDDLVRRFSSHTIEQLKDLPAGQEVILGGMMTQIRFQNVKKARNGNTRYARCRFEDLTGSAECVMWPDDFVKHKDDFVEDRVCFVKATVERTREEPGLVLARVLDLDQAQRELTRGHGRSTQPILSRSRNDRFIGKHPQRGRPAIVPFICTSVT